MAPLAPLSAPEARSRLKGNLAGFALVCFARTLFTPYLALRAVLVSAIDSLASSPRTARGGDYLWWIETVISGLLMFNIAQAAYWVQHPQPSVPPTPKGMTLVPILKSSPLTRSYPATPDLGTPVLGTPVRQNQQSPLAQSLYRATPPRGNTTPDRNGSPVPLSSSTARALNLSQNGTPSSTGLFYDDTLSSSPSKVARGAAGTAGSTPPKQASSRSDFVVVDREQREWVDNVWKGVRGKSRKLGL